MTTRGFDIRVLGDKKLDRAFRNLGKKVQTKFLKRAAREAAYPIRKAAKSLAPKGATGALARGISIRAGRPRRRGDVSIIVATGTRKKMGLPEYNKAGKGGEKFYYPAHVELGTQHMAARPFLRPALAQNRQRSKAIMARTLWRMIEGETKLRLGSVAKGMME